VFVPLEQRARVVVAGRFVVGRQFEDGREQHFRIVIDFPCNPIRASNRMASTWLPCSSRYARVIASASARSPSENSPAH